MVINYGVGADEAIACSPDVAYEITRATKTQKTSKTITTTSVYPPAMS